MSIYNEVASALDEFGLLLKTDSSLPNLFTIVTGERLRGSWWSHPQSRRVFEILQLLAQDNKVLTTKLVSGKDTFIHRKLWNSVVLIGLSRSNWQVAGLTAEEKLLLRESDRMGTIQTAGPAAASLEKRLLVHSAQIHASGHHEKLITNWTVWAQQHDFRLERQSNPEPEMANLENTLTYLNRRFAGRGVLPWQPAAIHPGRNPSFS